MFLFSGTIDYFNSASKFNELFSSLSSSTYVSSGSVDSWFQSYMDYLSTTSTASVTSQLDASKVIGFNISTPVLTIIFQIFTDRPIDPVGLYTNTFFFEKMLHEENSRLKFIKGDNCVFGSYCELNTASARSLGLSFISKHNFSDKLMSSKHLF